MTSRKRPLGRILAFAAALLATVVVSCVTETRRPGDLPGRRLSGIRDFSAGKEAPFRSGTPDRSVNAVSGQAHQGPGAAVSGQAHQGPGAVTGLQPGAPIDGSRPASQAATAAGADPSTKPHAPPPDEQDPLLSRNPYIRFGSQIVVHADGKITKFFPMRASRGKFMSDLLVRYVVIAPTQIEIIPSADIQDLRVAPYQQPTPPTQIPVSDWLAVTGTFDEIERAERFVNLYFSSIPQIEIEARIAEVTTSDVVDLGVRSTNPAKPSIEAGKNNFIQSINPKFPNASGASEGLISLTAVQSPIQFQATLEMLASRRDVDIISTPRIAVRNGGRAEIVNGTEIPFAEITTVVGGVPTSTLRYKQTGIKLYISPYLAGSDTILLNLEVESSIPTNVTETSTIAVNPIIATRSAKTDVQIRDGNTFVIGGLISTNNLEQVNKVPLLGDIPLLGMLFRSTLTQKTYTEVLFFITPRVIRDQGTQGIISPNLP